MVVNWRGRHHHFGIGKQITDQELCCILLLGINWCLGGCIWTRGKDMKQVECFICNLVQWSSVNYLCLSMDVYICNRGMRAWASLQGRGPSALGRSSPLHHLPCHTPALHPHYLHICPSSKFAQHCAIWSGIRSPYSLKCFAITTVVHRWCFYVAIFNWSCNSHLNNTMWLCTHILQADMGAEATE